MTITSDLNDEILTSTTTPDPDEKITEASPEALEHLERIQAADKRLTERYREARLLQVNPELDRRLVSFQANKREISSRWFKYKEGFSTTLMHYVFDKAAVGGAILDPFAGSGTALFAASDVGIDATGIELLPSSTESIEVKTLLRQVDRTRMALAIRSFAEARSWEAEGGKEEFSHIAITAGAFPEKTGVQLARYLHDSGNVAEANTARVLRFAAMCILEAISYTRKDGQYLRWDYRSERTQGKKPFNKGVILEFTGAIVAKLEEIASDLCTSEGLADEQGSLFEGDATAPKTASGAIHLLSGSCLEILPTLGDATFDAIITSPPYCNRYDYTRTYALELAMMGVGEKEIRHFRQTMLSCTVENRDKDFLSELYADGVYSAAKCAWESHEVLGLILAYLEFCRREKIINNPGIPRMVKNYFAEMALMIFEGARVLKPGSSLVMVNDNVRYAGAHIPVDLILSDIAQAAGMRVEAIWVLPRGKGNSSQQMGLHGREEVRKCVYVWRKD